MQNPDDFLKNGDLYSGLDEDRLFFPESRREEDENGEKFEPSNKHEKTQEPLAKARDVGIVFNGTDKAYARTDITECSRYRTEGCPKVISHGSHDDHSDDQDNDIKGNKGKYIVQDIR